MRVKRLPTILALHLKRFKYVEQYNRHIKVCSKMIFWLKDRLKMCTSKISKGLNALKSFRGWVDEIKYKCLSTSLYYIIIIK